MKRGYLIPVVLMIFLISSATWAQTKKSSVIGSPHDVGSLGCKSCHAAHDGAASPGLPTGGNYNSGTILLWDRNFSTTTFNTYDSPSMQSKATEVGGTTTLVNTEARMNSLLCMSCHDGITTTSVIPATDIGAVGNTTYSAGLKNDHPVNMAYDPTKDISLATVASVTTGGLTLYGTSNTVQCSSCHTSHDNSLGKFLRKTNTGSALCVTCHP